MNRLQLAGVIAAGIIVVLIGYFCFYEPDYDGPITVPDHTLVFSHRGFGKHGPDNSLAAAKLALANGLDGIDVDGQYTKDGEFIIFHDLSVDRLTSGTGKVRDKTLSEMLALDLGPKFNESFRGSYVSTFEDFVTAVNGTAILMVELKVPGAAKTGIEERAVHIIEEHDAYDYVYLSSFNPIALYRVKKLNPRVHTVLIFMDTNWNPELLAEIPEQDRVDLPWLLRQEPVRRAIRKIVKPDLLSVNYEVSARTRARLLNNGWPIFLWTPNTQGNITAALKQHPYGVITDEPLVGKTLRDAQ